MVVFLVDLVVVFFIVMADGGGMARGGGQTTVGGWCFFFRREHFRRWVAIYNVCEDGDAIYDNHFCRRGKRPPAKVVYFYMS